MGMALDTVGGNVTNPSTTITAYTPNTGDSFTVRNFNPGTPSYLINMWGLGATAGIQQLRSPRLHDNVRGIRAKLLAADSRPTWNIGRKQTLYPQDSLVFEASGGASEIDSGAFLVFYGDIAGMNSHLINNDQLDARLVNIVTLETTHTAAATGNWASSIAFNTSPFLLKANTDYAVLGYLTDTVITSFGVYGPDTGNLKCGGPGTSVRTATRDYFTELSRLTGLPTIPVVNAANGGSTFAVVQHNASATVVVETILAELR